MDWKRAGVTKPTTTLVLLGVTLAGTVVLALAPGVARFLWLEPGGVDAPLALHTLVTYAFAHAGILPWVLSVPWLLAAGAVIERHLSGKRLWTVIVVAVVMGGVVFGFAADPDSRLLGGAVLTYAYLGAVLGCWLAHRRTIGWAGHLVSAVAALWVLVMLAGPSPLKAGLLATAVAASTTAGAFASDTTQVAGAPDADPAAD